MKKSEKEHKRGESHFCIGAGGLLLSGGLYSRSRVKKVMPDTGAIADPRLRNLSPDLTSGGALFVVRENGVSPRPLSR